MAWKLVFAMEKMLHQKILIQLILTQKKMRFNFWKDHFLLVFLNVCVKKTFYTRSLLLNRKLLNLSFIRERNYIKEKTDSKKIESNHVYFISYLIKLCVYCIYNLLILHIINWFFRNEILHHLCKLNVM